MAEDKRSRFWIWIVVAIGLHLAAWAAWLTLASRHPVPEVPVAGSPAR